MTKTNEETGVALRSVEPGEVIVAAPMSTEAVINQQRRIAHCMGEVMTVDIDYGTIPGTKKPSLFKPGSEKILTMFRIACDPEVVDLGMPGESVRYRVTCRLLDQHTGAFLGAGIGEASSEEARYNWRAAVCDEEFDETPPELTRTKWEKKFGKARKVKQVRTNPADQANTILKMAKKRAQVDAVLTVTAASALFTQDVEDIPRELLGEITDEKRDAFEDTKPAPVAEPQAKSKAAAKKTTTKAKAKAKPAADPEVVDDDDDGTLPDATNPVKGMKDDETRVITVKLEEVDSRQGTYKKGKREGETYTQVFVKFCDGIKASGFHSDLLDSLASAAEAGAMVTLAVKRSGKFLNIEELVEVVFSDDADTTDDAGAADTTDDAAGDESF